MGVTFVDDDLAGRAASAASTEITCWRAPAKPTCDGSSPRSATVSSSTGFDFAAAIPLNEGYRGSTTPEVTVTTAGRGHVTSS